MLICLDHWAEIRLVSKFDKICDRFFSPSVRMRKKSVNFGDKDIEIDYTDVTKILAFEEELLINYISNLKRKLKS